MRSLETAARATVLEATPAPKISDNRSVIVAAADQLARCYLARPDRHPSDLAAGLRILTESPPELIEAAIAYCANKGWLDGPDDDGIDDDGIDDPVRRHVK